MAATSIDVGDMAFGSSIGPNRESDGAFVRDDEARSVTSSCPPLEHAQDTATKVLFVVRRSRDRAHDAHIPRGGELRHGAAPGTVPVHDIHTGRADQISDLAHGPERPERSHQAEGVGPDLHLLDPLLQLFTSNKRDDTGIEAGP